MYVVFAVFFDLVEEFFVAGFFVFLEEFFSFFTGGECLA